MRGLLLQVHRYLGLTTLALLVVASATGVLLVFSRDLDAYITPELHETAERGSPPSAAGVVDTFQRQHPSLEVLSFPLAPARGRTLELKVAASTQEGRALSYDQLFLDPYSSRIVGVRRDTPGWDRVHLMKGIYVLHYTLLAGDVGRWLMGSVALGWLINNLVGFYLTLPESGSFWKRWRQIWTVNPRAKWPRFLLELHRASGLWLFIGVMVLSATSVAMNFYAEAAHPIVTALSPPKPTPWDHPAPTDHLRTRQIGFAEAERIALADRGRSGARLRPAVETYDPAYHLVGVRFTRDGLEDYAGYGLVSYYLDDATGRLVYIDDPATDSTGAKVLRSLYPLHSGQIAWLPTRLLTILLGLAVLEMSFTGVVVWWRKRKPRVELRRTRLRAHTTRNL